MQKAIDNLVVWSTKNKIKLDQSKTINVTSQELQQVHFAILYWYESYH